MVKMKRNKSNVFLNVKNAKYMLSAEILEFLVSRNFKTGSGMGCQVVFACE